MTGHRVARLKVGGPVGARRDVVFLRVTDTGAGIPLEKQEMIFEPFAQLHRSHAGDHWRLSRSRAIARIT